MSSDSIKAFAFIYGSPSYGKKNGSQGWYNAYIGIRKDLLEEDWYCPWMATDFDGEEYDMGGYWNPPFDVHGGVSTSWIPRSLNEIRAKESFVALSDIPSEEDMRNYRIFGWDYGHLGDTIENSPLERVKVDTMRTLGEYNEYLA